MAPSLKERFARRLKVKKEKKPVVTSEPKARDTGTLVPTPSCRDETTVIPSDKPPPFQTGNTTPSDTSLTTNSNELILQEPITIEDLWDLAYNLLKDDETKSRLMKEYEDILLESSTGDRTSPPIALDNASAEGRQQQASKILQDKFQAVQDAQWRITIFSKDIAVWEQFDRVVGAVTSAKGFITQAVSPGPHAALAWAGVCVILPLLLNPSLQWKAAVKGLDTVSNLIRQSKVIDEIYARRKADAETEALRALANAFRDKRITLYSQILEFEARLVCYLSASRVEQTVRSMVKHDSWDGMVGDIQEIAKLSDDDRQIIDAEKMKSGFEKIDHISKSIEEGFLGVRRRWEAQDRQDILSWLSSINSLTGHNDTSDRRQEGTGLWLFDNPVFERWISGEEKTLWCSGIPGAGKTILASAVISYLERRFYQDNVTIAFLYCNYKERDTQTLQNLIGSLTQQVVQRNPDVPDDLKDLYKTHSQRQPLTPPTPSECVQLLKRQLSYCKRVFLVIDALDECDANTRRDLCDYLQQLKEKSGNINLMVTSRDIPELEEDIRPTARLDILANDNDIEIYIEEKIKTMSRLKRHTQKDPELRDIVKQTVRNSAKGMFLLAQLHLETLANKQTPNDVRQAVRTLPTSLPKKYDELMDRIGSQNDDDAQLGKKVLSWISHAKRPLTVAEMQHAVKIESTTTRIEKLDLISQDILVSVCAGIVTVDKESSIIRLVHYSAQEYFQKTGPRKFFQDAQHDLANACLTYLLFDNFAKGYCETYEARRNLLKENSLANYAACHWADHLGETTEPITEVALTFLQDTARTSLSYQLMPDRHQYGGYSLSPPKLVTGLHLCAYFGLHSLATKMLEMHQAGIDAEDSKGQKPIVFAVERGHEDVVKMLLLKGASGNSPFVDPYLLDCAVWTGQLAVAKVLIDGGADTDPQRTYDTTPLELAVRKRDVDMAKLLIQRGANVNRMSRLKFTPLRSAVLVGLVDTVELLLNEGASVDLRYRSDSTPLHEAALRGMEDIVDMLLKRGADLNKGDECNETPLYKAAMCGHEGLVRRFIEKGVNVDSEDRGLRTPLSRAAGRGYAAVVETLLEKGANVDSEDRDLRTPLSWAAGVEDAWADRGFAAVVEALLDKGANPDLWDQEYKTPLMWAADIGHEVVVKLLLGKGGADVNLGDENEETALAWAVRKRHEAVAKVLREKGGVMSAPKLPWQSRGKVTRK